MRAALTSSIAATLAWWLASQVTGDPRPVFASVTTVVALAPGVANPRLQIVGFLSGIGIGLAIGTMARHFVVSEPVLIIGPVVFAAMLVAASFGRSPLILIQAGASALLVIGSAAADAGRYQLVGALIGGGVAIAFSQIFFAPDPVPRLNRSAQDVADAAELLLTSLPHPSDEGWLRIESAAIQFEQAIAQAQGVRRWTLRGRFNAGRIETAEHRWLKPSRRLIAIAQLAYVAPSKQHLDELRLTLGAFQQMLGPTVAR